MYVRFATVVTSIDTVFQKMTRLYYAEKTNPGKHGDESESDAEGEHHHALMAGTVHEPDAADGRTHGEEGSQWSKRKKGPYAIKEGPTVYKLIKPVLKSVKEAKSNE